MAHHMGQMRIKDSFMELVFHDQWHYMKRCHMSRFHQSWAVDDGNHVMVPNPNEMISTTALVTRVNA
jgi:hypothetical protein